MTDRMTPEQRSRCMSRIRGKDTTPEMIVRRWLWQRGYRYRKHVKRLPGTPDIVLHRYGIVIFIHGCFWHGHALHPHMPKTNIAFWQAKINRNRARDAQQKKQLLLMGWNVLTIWECQLKPSERARTLAMIEYYINHSYLLRHHTAETYRSQENQDFFTLAAEPESEYN